MNSTVALQIEPRSPKIEAASEPRSTPTDELATLLGETSHRVWWQRPKVWVVIIAVIAVVAGTSYWQYRQHTQGEPHYITQSVTRGSLSLTVTANGTLQPTRLVTIGSELSGTVARVLVDVNDRVKKGQVLLELDTSKLRDQILRSRATVASAEAKVAQAVATVAEARGSLGRLEEVAKLSGGKVPSRTELETARATFERAIAEEASARASVADAKAALSSDETNLAKASIRSPIDGVVLTRSVEPGGAVAATLQAVTLFTIAEDLTQMRLQVNVDEADVGMVSTGQRASFTVSAYPDRKYPATITRVAYGSSTTDNVVTYVTYLDVDNRDLTLRPGMTATAAIAATGRRETLLVPNMALRYTPIPSAASTVANGGKMGEAPKAGGDGFVSKLLPRPPGMAKADRPAAEVTTTLSSARRQVWTLRDGRPTPVVITTGASDGHMTEITSVQSKDIDLQPGTPVITDQIHETQ